MLLALAPQPLPLSADQDGAIRVHGTRVTLDSVVGAFKEGRTAEEIASQFPSLGLAAVYAAISFYLSRQDEVEAYLCGREDQHASARARAQARWDQAGLRERLMARRNR